MSREEKAVYIVRKLTSMGHTAYFAGGWVRDFVMKRPSSDIDIATSAKPQEVLDLFPHTLLVGIAFGVVIVMIDGIAFEVSTFREDFEYTDGRKPAKVTYSNAFEDAKRRDFTINGMFYDPIEDKIHDFVGGIEDIERKVVKTIGNPDERFFEDRLRMIRAIRFASKFGFHIDLETQEAILANAVYLFPSVAKERIWQEFSKMAEAPRFEVAFHELHRLGLLKEIFPKISSLQLHQLEKLVFPLTKLGPEIPAILKLQFLFQDLKLDEKLEVAKDLKVSNKDLTWILWMDESSQIEKMLEEDLHLDFVRLAKFYALPGAEYCLACLAATLDDEQKRQFYERHKNIRRHLQKAIDRIVNKTPLVTASHLMQEGVKPGKKMGELLVLAEKISIEKGFKSVDEVIFELKNEKHLDNL